MVYCQWIITFVAILKRSQAYMLLITLYFFIAIVAIQLVYYLVIFGKFAFAKAQKITPNRVPVSVIV
jgi:hypothetical protein